MNKNKIKSVLPALAITLLTTSPVYAGNMTLELCSDLGRITQTVAESRNAGISQAQLEQLIPADAGKEMRSNFLLIIRTVYTTSVGSNPNELAAALELGCLGE